jgi:hypothetical protein
MEAKHPWYIIDNNTGTILALFENLAGCRKLRALYKRRTEVRNLTKKHEPSFEMFSCS